MHNISLAIVIGLVITIVCSHPIKYQSENGTFHEIKACKIHNSHEFKNIFITFPSQLDYMEITSKEI